MFKWPKTATDGKRWGRPLPNTKSIKVDSVSYYQYSNQFRVLCNFFLLDRFLIGLLTPAIIRAHSGMERLKALQGVGSRSCFLL